MALSDVRRLKELTRERIQALQAGLRAEAVEAAI
jgi:hypothetical protein